MICHSAAASAGTNPYMVATCAVMWRRSPIPYFAAATGAVRLAPCHEQRPQNHAPCSVLRMCRDESQEGQRGAGAMCCGTTSAGNGATCPGVAHVAVHASE